MERNPPAGRIAENIMHFARLLRSAGIPVGSGKVLDAIKALEILGIGSQEDLYWALFSQFVSKNNQRELFDQAFYIRKASKLLTGDIKDKIIPIPIFKCATCGHVNEIFKPNEL